MFTRVHSSFKSFKLATRQDTLGLAWAKTRPVFLRKRRSAKSGFYYSFSGRVHNVPLNGTIALLITQNTQRYQNMKRNECLQLPTGDCTSVSRSTSATARVGWSDVRPRRYRASEGAGFLGGHRVGRDRRAAGGWGIVIQVMGFPRLAKERPRAARF